MEIKNIHRVALLLDPRKRSLKMYEDEKQKNEIKELLLKEMKLNENKVIKTVEPPTKKLRPTITPVNISDLFNDDDDDEDKATITNASLREHEHYFNAKFKPEKTDDLLKFWYLNSTKFPVLFQVAKKLLAVPATEFESERNFSITGRVCESRRSSLDPIHVDQAVFIKNHLKY